MTITLGLVGGVLTVLQALLVSQAVNRAFLLDQSLVDISRLLEALLGLIILRAFLAWGVEVSAHGVARQIKMDLRQRLFDHLLALGPLFTRSQQTGELTHTIAEGIEALDTYFSQYLPQVVLSALVPVSILLFVFPLDPLSGLILLLTAPLIPLFMVLLSDVAESLTRKQWQTLSRMSAFFLDTLQGLTALKILGRSRERATQIARVSEKHRQATMSVLRVTFLSALSLELIATLSTAVVAVQIGLRLLYGYLSFEQAFFVLILAPEFYLPLRTLGSRFHAGMAGVTAAGRIFTILDSSIPAQTAISKDGSQLLPHLAQPAGVTFEDVHYSYPDGTHALRGVSFTLPARKTTALIGPSGAGKSTIAALLLGFDHPSQGQIRLASENSLGEEIRIAWVPQNPYLFDGSLMANIRLGKPDASMEEVIRAARLAHADDFINHLPLGYDTVIGERGARLSGGQAQRIALARAFLVDAPLLVLDEPAANLDPSTEELLQESIARLKENRTVLVIAHRLGTTSRADQVLALDQGRVEQAGSPAELAERDGLYRNLLRAAGGTVPEGLPYATNKRVEVTTTSSSTEAPTTSKNVGTSTTTSSAEAPTTSKNVGASTTGNSTKALTFFRLASIIFRPSLLPLMGLSVLLGCATIASSIGLMSASAYIIARAALHPSIAVLQVAIVGVRFFGLSRGIFRYLERLASHNVTFRVLARLRVQFYQALEPLAPARLASYHSGDLLSRVIEDIASLENFYVGALAPPFVAVILSLAMTVYMGTFGLSFATALFCFLALAGFGVPIITRWLSLSPGRQIVAARSQLNVELVDGIQGMADLLAFGQGRRQSEKIRTTSQRLAESQTKMAHITGLQTALGLLLANAGMLTALALGISLDRAGRLEGYLLPVVVLAVLASFEAVLPLPQAAAYLETDLQAARRLFELVDAPAEITPPARPLPLPVQFDLAARDLSFHYPDQGDIPVLRDISFSIAHGKRVALVGPSGAGKTTLISLLMRFWEYQGGEILLDNHDLRAYDPAILRDSMAVVSQNTYLFTGTLRDNLLLAQPQASEADIVDAARKAQIHTFIQSLPQGYDTWIGEHGLRLSAGERQRLAIARALLKDAILLILDEPTAHLDAQTEEQVLAAIRLEMSDRTAARSVLVATHRLVGMDWMDEILVLDGGRIVERGRHEDLLARRGLYWQMWVLQQQALTFTGEKSRQDVY